MIGITVPMGPGTTRGTPITTALATPGMVELNSIEEAQNYPVPVLQGAEKAVIPQADETTGFVAPPVAGGLQMQKMVLVHPAEPVPLTVLQTAVEKNS